MVRVVGSLSPSAPQTKKWKKAELTMGPKKIPMKIPSTPNYENKAKFNGN